ncbi:MAG: glycosyltransferase family 39 protein [Chloroflexi bacterium]|nr:glycosyltransferase family 39 protein [Chloroflexota bacterium]
MFVIILIVGAALRFYQIGAMPPGLYQDEAYNGLDALKVIGGARPLYFAANNGREPFYIYLVALGVAALGRTPAAARLPAAILGALTIPAAYALGRALFSRRAGLLAAAITAGSFWALALSRIGLRAVALPLFTALSLACAASGWRSRRLWLVALGGAFYGFTFYTYLAARFTPLALILFLIFWYIARPHTFPRPRWLAAFGAPAVLVVAPLAAVALNQPDLFFGRAAQVSIFSAAVNGGDMWGTLFHNLIAALGMFVVRGDAIARHNLPGRPVFDPILGAAFVAGVLISLRRALGAERDRAAALALIWTGVMLVPTILAEDAPHFLRGVGVLPMALLFPALGLDVLMSWARDKGHRIAGIVVAACAVTAGFGLTVNDYFGRYALDPDTAYLFQSAATELARDVNATTGVGWTGGLSDSPLPEGEGPGVRPGVGAGASAYLDLRLWDTFPSLRFLLPQSDRLTVFDERHPFSFARGARAVVYLWPYDRRPRAVLSGIPPGMLIGPMAGPLARGDLEPAPYSLYSVYRVEPFSANTPSAEFEGGFRLYSISRTADADGVELIWGADRAPAKDYQVFAQALVNGNIVAQADGPLGAGLYPSSWWRAGEIVRESRRFDLPLGVNTAGLTISVGLYDPATGERLKRLDAPGDAADITP